MTSSRAAIHRVLIPLVLTLSLSAFQIPCVHAAGLGASDGAGGSIFLWTDGSGACRLQRVNALGAEQWAREGVRVTTTEAAENAAALVEDGAGGVIVTWQDARTGAMRVYAQRVDGAGARQWGDAGVSVSPADAFQAQDILADGAGGAFVAWADSRSGTSDIFVQRLVAGGEEGWTPGGVLLAGTSAQESGPKLASDDAGGVLIAWTTAQLSPRDVMARRVLADGSLAWAGPIQMLASAGVQQLVGDAAGGAIALAVSDPGDQFLAQRLGAGGTLPWGSTGRVIAAFDQVTTWGLMPAMVEDGAGGIVASWNFITGASTDRFVEATRLDADGEAAWAGAPVTLGPVRETGVNPRMAADGAGGAVIAWANLDAVSMNVYARRVLGDGTLQWTAGGLPVCTVPRYQSPFAMVGDGAGGVTIGWSDWRNAGAAPDVYAQRVSAAGVLTWRSQGAPVYLSRIGQRTPSVASDGAGGAVAAWMEEVDGVYQIRAQVLDPSGQPLGPIRVLTDVEASRQGPVAIPDGAGGAIVGWTQDTGDAASGTYLQRITSGSTVLWTAGGVKVSDATELPGSHWLSPDATGGALAAWVTGVVRAQHVDAAGVAQWGADGALVSSAVQSSRSVGPTWPNILSDATGGAFVVWSDGRWYDNHCISGCGYAVMAQRLDADGVPQWATDGIELKSRYQSNSRYVAADIAGDGSGGLFATWSGGSSAATVYAQHVDAAGTLAWAVDGVALSPSLTAGLPRIAATAPGEAVAIWPDSRSGSGLDLYAQHLAIPGPGAWTAGGVEVCTESGDQSDPRIVADGSGGFIAAWADSRADAELDVYAQRGDASGARLWDPAGVAVSTGPGGQQLSVLARENDGGAVFAWQDGRTGFAPEIGLARLGPDGSPLWDGSVSDVGRPTAPASLSLAAVWPNPARGAFTVRFSLPDARPARLEVLDLAGRRRLSADVPGGAGTRVTRLDPAGLPAGLYLLRLVHASGVRSVKAVLLP